MEETMDHRYFVVNLIIITVNPQDIGLAICTPLQSFFGYSLPAILR